jgi:hypothetical protein
MAKSFKEVLNGVKKSKVEDGSTGSDPGVDYAPKAEGEQNFVKKHTVEKHSDRVGNEEQPYKSTTKYVLKNAKENKHGRDPEHSKQVYESSSSCSNDPDDCMCSDHGGKKSGKSLKAFKKNVSESDNSINETHTADGDESAEMTKTELRALANKALHLVMQLSDSQVVEPWVQAKIAVAKENVSSVHDYMIYGNHQENEQSSPYDGGIDMSGSVPNTYPNLSVDVWRNV